MNNLKEKVAELKQDLNHLINNNATKQLRKSSLFIEKGQIVTDLNKKIEIIKKEKNNKKCQTCNEYRDPKYFDKKGSCLLCL